MAGSMLLKVKDVARIMSISERAVYRLAEERKIPCIKWDRSVRFDPVDVAKFIEDNRREAIDYEAIADTMCV
jgi:excisionase family DNA binding protein